MAAARLSEAEVTALRDEAQRSLLISAGERLRFYDPERCGGDVDQAHDEDTVRMMAAAEVYGALRNVELAFSTAKGLPGPAESAQVAFTERAMAWMKTLRDEVRHGLEDQRGSVEVTLDGTPGETFLLFVLDGICDRGES